jgi:hypothetical protein
MLEDAMKRRGDPGKETPDDKLTFEFVEFAKGMEATSGELESAYLHLMGIEEGEIVNPKVKILRDEMERLTRMRFPVSRFAQLVTTKNEYENGTKIYLEYLNTLPLSEKEIQVLYSIASKTREGELEFFHDGNHFARVKVEQNTDKDQSALLLKNAIEKVMTQIPQGGKMTIAFTEK